MGTHGRDGVAEFAHKLQLVSCKAPYKTALL